MADDNDEDRKFVSEECGLAYGTKITAYACSGVDRQLAYRRAIGL